MTKLTLMNSIVDAVYITRDTSYEYTSEKPTWDNYTVMYCEFQGNVLESFIK